MPSAGRTQLEELFIGIVIIVALVWLARRAWPPRQVDLAKERPQAIDGTLSDVELVVARCLGMPASFTFIAQIASDSDLFVQFTGNGRDVLFNFPLITPSQRRYESAIRQTAELLGHSVQKGGDDLEIQVQGDSAEIARLTREFLQRVYRVTRTTPLQLESFGEV